jgi:integrase
MQKRGCLSDLVLADPEGQEALRMLEQFLGERVHHPQALVFHSRNGSPLRETKVLVDGLHPALKAVGLPRAGMHAFRHGCNRRWELAGVNPAVFRQQMGHSTAAMTARYTGEIPIDQVRAAFFNGNGNKIVVLENMENDQPIHAVAYLLYNQPAREVSGRRTMAV